MVVCIVLGIILFTLGIIIFSIIHLEVRFFADAKGYELNLSCRYLSLEYLCQKNKETSTNYLWIKIFGWKIKKVIGKPHRQEIVEEEQEKEKSKENKDIMDSLTQFELVYKHIHDELFETLHYFSDKLKINRFWVISQIGLDDAAETAIAAGIFYALMTPVSAVIYQNFPTKNMKIEAKPCYNETVLNIHCDAAVQIRVLHLVTLAVKVLKLVRKATKINSHK